MRMTIALMADDSFQKMFQERHDAICHEYKFTPDNHGFWPHVSLKMPFTTTDLNGVETYFREFAATVPPLTFTLTGLDLWTMPTERGSGVLFLNVAEQSALHILHEQLNQGLARRFEDTQAPFDGLEFHFHLTLMAGGASAGTYQHILSTEGPYWPLQSCRIIALNMAFQDTAAPDQGWQSKQL